MHRSLPLLTTVISLFLLSVIFFHPEPVNRSPLRASEALLKASKQAIRGPAKQPNDWFMRSRVNELGELDMDRVRHARAQAMQLRSQAGELDEPWVFEGPTNIGGRLTAVVADPTDPETIYAGAALGGVFQSTDGGLTFEPIFQEDGALSSGALAMDPQNPSTLWFGSGEANASGDSYPGIGIYLSGDGGGSWQHKGLPESYHIGKIIVDPTDSDRVFVAVTGKLFGFNEQRGVYRTTDRGDTWERVHFINDSTGAVDLAINSNNPDSIYAVMWERFRGPAHRQVGGVNSGVWRSVDGGDTWTQLTNGLPHDDPNLGRGALAISPDQPSRLYLTHSGADNLFIGGWRSDDGGDSWQEMDLDGYGNDVYSSFGWYFGESLVEPGNPDVLYIGGVQTIRTLNGGDSWGGVFFDAHVDNHGFWIDPASPSTVLSAHDGGFNRSHNRGGNSTRFSWLPVTQFYAITHDPSIPHRLYGGTQDNGTMRTPDGEVDDWEQIFGADGFYCLVDPRDSDVIFACYQWGNLLRSTDGGENWDFITFPFSGDRSNWMTPYTFDPFDYDRLYLGTYRVWQTNDQGNNWTPISEDLTDGDDPGGLTFGTITTISASSAMEGLLLVGTDDGNVWRSANGGDTWMQVDDDLPDVWVSRVATHPDSAMVMYAAFSGHRVGDPTPYLYRSQDGGQNWSPIDDGLPDGPINDVIIDPDDPLRLYVGTDFGVFASLDYGQTWEALGTGLPLSAVFDLEFIPATRRLVAGTHGRGMYSIELAPVSVVSDPGAPLPLADELKINNYPNPFNSATTVQLSLPAAGHVRVQVFDLLGRRVAILQDGTLPRGRHEFSWSAMDVAVASGSYIIVAEAGGQRVTRKVQLVR